MIPARQEEGGVHPVELIELRPAILFAHVLAAFAFVLCHGVAVFVGFAIRADPAPARVRHLLELSSSALPAMYIALLIALITGIAGAIIGGQFGQLWPWLSIGVVIVAFVAMYVFASMPFARLRHAVGLRSQMLKKDDPDPTPVSAEEVAAVALGFRPWLVAVVGLVTLTALIWLMRFRPF
jgi:hypothetical protein